jgi:hypothetical protein
LIGVIAKPDQRPVVEEFFELFKTPWEFYRAGTSYEVVIATAGEIPQPAARLLISYGAARQGDGRLGFIPAQRYAGGTVSDTDGPLPVYGDVLTFKQDQPRAVCLRADVGIVGLRAESAGGGIIRVGFDLFEEVRFLLSSGQPVENAHIPALDVHVSMLRRWILAAGIPIVEIPPTPAGHDFAVCLTHDIDFVGIRRHKLDHTMWGFLYRSTVGALWEASRGRLPLRRLLRMWQAAASLPFVYLGWVKDFWEPFAWYLKTEQKLPATYYLIPFKGRPGDQVAGRGAGRRATAYDISDVKEWAARLLREGCEIGVHGIDAWHDANKGRDELARIAEVTGATGVGIRMHWLLRNAETASILDESGYLYDSTAGYNETVGYRAGTTQVYRPHGARRLLELPMHIQDGALFYPKRLGLSEPEADERCQCLIGVARRLGGVLTVLWHDRSHGPERFWGDFYVRLLGALRSSNAWFGTGAQVVGWFRHRRQVRFERADVAGGTRLVVQHAGGEITPLLCVRIYRPSARGASIDAAADAMDIPWNGVTAMELDSDLRPVFGLPEQLAAMASL